MADDDSKSSSKSKKATKKSGTKSTKSAQSSEDRGSKPAPKKSSSSSSSSSSEGSSSRRSSDAPRAEAAPSTSPGKVASTAAQHLLELTGRDIEGIIGLDKDDDGWRVQVEVLEVARIPNTTDVLALYEVDADSKGNLQGYRRIRRYVRGAPDDDR